MTGAGRWRWQDIGGDSKGEKPSELAYAGDTRVFVSVLLAFSAAGLADVVSCKRVPYKRS